MKKSLLILSACVCATGLSMLAEDNGLSQVVFDFTSEDAIKDVNVSNVEGDAGGKVDLSGKAFSNGAISIVFDKPATSYSNPEWSKASEVLVYNNTYMTVTATGDNCHIKRVVFDATQWPYIYDSDVTATPAFSNGFKMSDSDCSFTAVDESRYTSVKFDFFDRGKFNKITVEYTGESASVDDIVFEEDVEPIYYNLSGCRVNATELTPGVYICCKGADISKVLVR